MDMSVVYAILVVATVVIIGILFFANKTNSKLLEAFPPGTVDKVESLLAAQLDRFLQQGLVKAALTPDELDDQFYITGLQLRGWLVSGSPETGYTMTPPPTQAPPLG